MNDTLAPLARWENFYVIVGSSAGALTGLQFVVITLISEAQTASSMQEVSAFGTPTVVHLCAALLISAIVSAPWPSLWSIAVAVAVSGALGVLYSIRVVRQARRQTGYQPESDDWAFYVVLPLVAYCALIAGALLLLSSPFFAMFIVAATALALLFIGIRNAWDTVTYIAISRAEHRRKQSGEKREDAVA